MSIRIDGKALADEILTGLKQRVAALPVRPILAVIQIGENPSSHSYIRQKEKVARLVGIGIKQFKFPARVSFQTVAEKITQLNEDPAITGVIIQRPLPAHLSSHSFISAVAAKKDVDGFHEKSPFIPPISQAITHILSVILQTKSLRMALRNKKIVLVGRGETAGKPIGETLSKLNIPVIQVNSVTRNKEEFYKEADIIISCVGKRGAVKGAQVKPGVMLIGVGIERADEKLVGDYDEGDIKDKASFYTPTPGGTGPLNIAYLLSNLVSAAEKST
ncbi:bifunctional 5,10-methylenetetrahydrofolate dehydrogenase/5,10-methenyltetrahydrofolate cyclohydrolase [Candidatus Roizmanbacteria bacterium]|nr:bifunctional 5,10-methylenetetrahydrofolate dehydrogenase/5,10-methenyltetrahydrofolate cyclohydrolase [Candidatus Roizmanbacteria bacterium]